MRQSFPRIRILGRIGRWMAFFRKFGPLAGPYWSSEGKWRVRAMTAALVALTVLQIFIATSINQWIEHLFDSLETRDMERFLWLVGAAALIIAANIVVTIFHLVVKRWIKIGWRKWLTYRLLGEWMADGLHYKVTLFPGEHTNPDGRIAEDIRFATDNAIDLAHSLLYAILILVSFAAILWNLSGSSEMSVGGVSLYVPGHLVWIAVLYAAIGTVIALRLGLPLIRAQNLRQTTEADFRFGLAYARQHSLQVALLRGEDNEDRSLRALFRSAIRSWNLQTRALVSLFYFTSAWWVLSQVFPILVASPRYIAGAITLGILMQTAQAFQQMVGAMSWPVDNVSAVADWRASVERVLGLSDALAAARRNVTRDGTATIRVERGDTDALVFDRLSLAEGDGRAATKPITAAIAPGERVLVAGDAATGFKLFKALAGLWPWGSGGLALPAGGELFFASRRPYLPLRSLKAIVAYPESPRNFTDADIGRALERVGLGARARELDRRAHWGEILTEDEQRRLGFARILLFRPRWIMIQETLDAMTPDSRAAMLRVLADEAADAAIMVVGQAPDLAAFATHRLDLDAGTLSALAAVPPARTG